MKYKSFNSFHRLPMRIALIAAPAIGVAEWLLSRYLFDASALTATVTAVLFALACFGGIYLLLYRLVDERLKAMHRITRNIIRKRFENYESEVGDGSDELDYLVRQTIRASNTVEREIQRLNRIENYRKEFIGDISHELKTPIFAIQGFIETLLNGAIEDENVNRQFLKKAMRNVNRLIYLTKDLMEISKLETGELKSNLQDFPLKEVIVDVVESLQYKAKKEEVEIFVAEIDENLTVSADRNQIKQVLINLIENAVKYNKPGGSVTVGVRPSVKRQRVVVYVQDTGIGIEQQYIDRVTERFFRVDKSRSREKGGTGLGLAIVKHIMEAHGEEFEIESTPNEGSTFRFTLTRAEHAPVSV